MAFLNAGAGATTPGNPDPRFALHTRQGVEDHTGIGDEMTKQMNYKIGSSAVQAAGEVITAGYKGYNIAQLEKQINDEAVKPFLQGIDPEFQAQRAKTVAESQANLRGMESQNEGIFAQFGTRSGSSVVADLNASESGIVKEGQKLKASLGQGRMTQAEFEMRLRKITREAINRNPGLTKELLAHAQLVEEQSGIRRVKDPAKELDKAAAAQEKRALDLTIKQAAHAGVHIDPSRINEPHYMAERTSLTAQRFLDKQTHEDLTRLNAAGKIAEEYTQAQREHLAISATRGAYMDTMETLASLAGEASTGNAADKTAAITNMGVHIDEAVLEFNDKLSKSGISAVVRKENVDRYEGSLRRTLQVVSDDVSGKTISSLLNNQKNSEMRVQELNILRTTDVAALELRAKLGVDPAWIRWNQQHSEEAKGLEEQYASITRGLLDPNSLDSMRKRELHPGASNAAFFVSKALQSGSNAVAGKIITTAKELTVDFADKHFGSDVTGKVQAQGDIIREIGKLKDLDNINLSTEDRASFRALTGDYLQYAGTKFSREVAKLEADYGVDVYTRFDKDGRMIVEQKALNGRQAIAPHSEITKLNTLYATAFNDSVQAMAAIHKDSWASSSQTLVNNYADTWQFNDPGNPLIDLVNEKKKNRGIDVNAKDMIKQEEGFRNSAYEDSAGVPTIGYGFTTVGGQKVKIGDTMTRQEAEAELQVQLPKYQTFKSKVKVDLNEDQEAALTSFEYNLGKGIWDKGAKSILYAINSGDFSHAQELMLKYDKARDPKTGLLKQLPGLSNRRGREATMLAKG